MLKALHLDTQAVRIKGRAEGGTATDPAESLFAGLMAQTSMAAAVNGAPAATSAQCVSSETKAAVPATSPEANASSQVNKDAAHEVAAGINPAKAAPGQSSPETTEPASGNTVDTAAPTIPPAVAQQGLVALVIQDGISRGQAVSTDPSLAAVSPQGSIPMEGLPTLDSALLDIRPALETQGAPPASSSVDISGGGSTSVSDIPATTPVPSGSAKGMEMASALSSNPGMPSQPLDTLPARNIPLSDPGSLPEAAKAARSAAEGPSPATIGGEELEPSALTPESASSDGPPSQAPIATKAVKTAGTARADPALIRPGVKPTLEASPAQEIVADVLLEASQIKETTGSASASPTRHSHEARLPISMAELQILKRDPEMAKPGRTEMPGVDGVRPQTVPSDPDSAPAGDKEKHSSAMKSREDVAQTGLLKSEDSTFHAKLQKADITSAETLVLPVKPGTVSPHGETTAARPNPVFSQVEGSIRWILQNKAVGAELQLHPESLGRMTIQIRVEGQEVHARLWASESSSLPILQEHKAFLEASLKEQGLKLGSFDLQFGARHEQAQTTFQERAMGAASGRLLPVETKQEIPSNGPSRGSLDSLNPHQIEVYA